MSGDPADAARADFRRSVRAALARSATGTAPVWAPAPLDAAQVAQSAALGWTGLLVDEDFGGAGAGMLEAIVVAEELGAQLSPIPFLSTAVLAATALSVGGSAEQHQRWLPRLASGEARATVAQTGLGGRLRDDLLGIDATPADGEFVLNGAAGFVLDTAGADLLIVAVRAGTSTELFAVEAGVPGLHVEEHLAVDRSRRVSTITLHDVRLPPSALLPNSAAGLAALVQRSTVALGADALGAARRALQLSVAYAKQREQFGRPIGSFQAIKHKLADMYVLVQGAELAVEGAARAIDAGADARALVAVAGSYAIDAATKVTGDAIQVHGGIGYTWEHPCHQLFKRAKFDELYLGDPASHRETLAQVILGH